MTTKSNISELWLTAHKLCAYLISQPQLFLAQLHTPAQALSHTESLVIQLPGKLQADASQTRIALGVDTKTRCQLADDGAEVAGFEAGTGGEGTFVDGERKEISIARWKRGRGEEKYVLPVHGVTYPDYGVT